MRKIIPLIIFLKCANAYCGLELSEQSAAISDDPFSSYQWALKNQGQIQIEDLTDTRSIRTPGIAGMDLAWSPNLDPLFKRDAVVALIDSGIDLDHNELKTAIALNLAECENGRIPAKPKDDKDANGFIGDCMGWDFTTKQASSAPRPYDDIGHGTHLAGIIAARSDNSLGIRSISNHIKVLPLKVETSADSATQDSKTQDLIADRVAQAVRYAILRKVDVINLSLGWPIRQDSKALREVFAAAINSGIIVVAAAGNNGISAPVYPCAYDGVICVGAINPQGIISRYSNYGGHVDFLAPGDDILSTIPNKNDSITFGIKGYDFMSGSSQASAYIASVAATLKGIYPNASNAEIYARLVASSTMPPNQSEKFSLHGLPSLTKIAAGVFVPLVQPNFKDQDKILYKIQENSTVYKLKIKNFAKNKQSPVAVRVSTASGPVTIDYVNTISIAAESEITIPVPVKISNTDSDNQIELSVQIKTGAQKKIYRQRLLLVRKLADESAVKHIPILGKTAYELSTLFKDKVIPKLRSVPDKLFRFTSPEYYTTEIKDGDLNLTLFRIQNEKLQIAKTFVLKNTKGFSQLQLTDISLSGQSNYMLFTLHVDDAGQQYLQFTFLDQNFEPRFGANSFWKYVPEKIAARPSGFSFIAKTVPGFGRIAVPVQIDRGELPNADQNQDSLASRDGNSATRIYYFEPKLTPAGVTVTTRVIDNAVWQDKIRQDLGLTWRDRIAPLALFPQSLNQTQNGSAKLLFSAGRENLVKYYSLNLDALDTSDALPQPIDQSFSVGKAIFSNHFHVGQSTLNRTEIPVAAERYPGSRLRWSTIPAAGSKAIVQRLEMPDPREEIQSLLAVYQNDTEERAYVLTNQAIIEQVSSLTGELKSNNRAPVARFSFIPPALINSIYYSIYGGHWGDSFPAFYVDTSSINSDYIFVLSAKSGVLQAPASLSIQIPDNCASMDPAAMGSEHQSVATFFCKGQQTPELLQIPID